MHAVAPIREGLSPYATVLRITEAADRLHALADAAESRGRLGDATKAISAEVKTLGQLLSLGLKGAGEVDVARDAVELEESVAQLIRRAPASGAFIADALEQAGRPGYAAKFRRYADRCKIQILETKVEPSADD